MRFLNPDSHPLGLYHKATSLMWDPAALDFAGDKPDWDRLTDRERDLLLRLSSMFLVGEQAVAHDLAPMLVAVRRSGDHLEEEMFLTTQLFEEAKHVEAFDRWFRVMAPVHAAPVDLGENYRDLFDVALPGALDRLLVDQSPPAQVEALLTYHITVEGVLAETGYEGYKKALKTRGLMPATVRAVELVQRDEARHIAYGLHALSRLLRADPSLWPAAEARLSDLLGMTFGIIADAFAPYDDDIPFEMDPAEFVTYAADQYSRRMDVLERAKGV